MVVPGAAMAADTSRLPLPAERQVEFVRDIQPIFAESCYSCHGPDRQEANFRLDNRHIGIGGGDLGPAVLPGNSAESLLIHLVSGLNEDLIMPQRGPRLTDEQIGLLRAWIDQGADWPASASTELEDHSGHWAFTAPVRPELPEVENDDWARNSIDAFVLARLEQESMRPSPEADRVTLIRRLSLDLTGLPPTIEEVDAFVNDQSADAYEKLVERLLASPHHGERWGRHWLDVARYADTHGFEKDLPRSIWPYRDWVIHAINRDLPYDQFIVEQIAGDLLPGATLDQKVATGFLRNSMINEEGGVDPEQFRVESIIDRIDTMGKSILGLTVACAQCHNHKYDPISQREYYEFFAFLNNDDEPEIEVPSAEQQARRNEILQQIRQIEDELLANDPEIPARMAEWEEEMHDLVRQWVVLEPESYFGAVGTKFTKLSDNSLLATASNPPVSGYQVNVHTTLTNITAFRLEVLTDPNLPSWGPGRAKNGNFVLTELTIDAAPPGEASQTNRVALQNATADHEQPNYPVTAAIDGNLDRKSGWAVDGNPLQRNQNRKAVFETAEPVGFEGGTVLHLDMKQLHGGEHTVGRFRLSATTGERPVRADPLSAKLREILNLPREQRTEEQQRELFSFYRSKDERFAETNQKVAELIDGWPEAPTTMVLVKRDEPRQTHIFRRGDFLSPANVVDPGVPAILHPLPEGAPAGRLGFAKWLVDRESPTTARTFVNRVWQHYFGRGLVATPEDLGVQSEPPSHPEMLDWLSVEFMDRGWSMKELHRLIVHSATYRQSSHVTPEMYEHDQFNILLGRGARFRVEAEIIRDIALHAGGLLTPKIGGPSVFPQIPDGVLSLGFGAPMKWPAETGEDRYRRAMYTFAKRAVPYPSLAAFDAPSGEFSCVQRMRSNTPLQALVTLNDPVFHEAAQALALRAYREGGSHDRARAEHAFRLCTGRTPTEREIDIMLELLEDQFSYFENRTRTAITVAVADPNNLPEEVNLHKVAAWTMVGRALLNLDETITRE